MLLSEFEYRKPETLSAASGMLLEKKNSMILAGGTDLFVKMRKGSHRPQRVVDIKNIEGLDIITWKRDRLFIGAAVDWTTLKNSSDVKKHFPALHQATKRFGCHEIRNRATLGGNICSASPGCESGGPCAVYEALVRVYGPEGRRDVPFSDFITGPGRTCLKEGELMEGVLIPKPPAGSRSAYRRTARVQGQDLATCALTVMAINPGDPANRQVRAGMSAVMKTPYRHPDLESILSKKEITPAVLEMAKKWMKENLYPRASSLRGTPEYKLEAMGGMLEILLEQVGVI